MNDDNKISIKLFESSSQNISLSNSNEQLAGYELLKSEFSSTTQTAMKKYVDVDYR